MSNHSIINAYMLERRLRLHLTPLLSQIINCSSSKKLLEGDNLAVLLCVNWNLPSHCKPFFESELCTGVWGGWHYSRPMIKFKSPIKSQSLQLVKRPFGNSRFKAIYVNLFCCASVLWNGYSAPKDAKSSDKNLRVFCQCTFWNSL